MKNLFIFILILIIFFPKFIAACNLNSFNFGIKFNQIELKEKLHLKLPENEVYQEISLPSDNYCPKESKIRGGIIKLVFLYQTLVQIRIEINNSKPVLEKWAENKFGKINNDIKKLKNYQYLWELGDYDVVYTSEVMGEKSFEFIEIKSSNF